MADDLANIFLVIDSTYPFSEAPGSRLIIPDSNLIKRHGVRIEEGGICQTFFMDEGDSGWSLTCRGKYPKCLYSPDTFEPFTRTITDRNNKQDLFDLQYEPSWTEFREEYDKLSELSRLADRRRPEPGCTFPHPYAFGTILIGSSAYPAFVMEELSDCTSLKILVENRRRGNQEFNAHETAQIGIKLLDGLEIMEQKHIAHADLSHNNVMVHEEMDNRGRPVIDRMYIIDFGQAKRDWSTVTPGRAGTPFFSAPEVVFKNKKNADIFGERNKTSVDIWSFGALLYYIRTGSCKLDAGVGSLRTEAECERCVELKEAGLSLPKTLTLKTKEDVVLNQLIGKCTKRLPRERPQLKEIKIDLQHILGPSVASQTPPVSFPEQTPPLTQSKPIPQSKSAPVPQSKPVAKPAPRPAPALAPKPKPVKGVFAAMYRMYLPNEKPRPEDTANLLVFGDSPDTCRINHYALNGTLYYVQQIQNCIDMSDRAWDINFKNNTCDSPWQSIAYADILSPIAPKTMGGWFACCNKLKSLFHFERIDSSKVTRMDSLFFNCSSLKTIHTSALDTSSARTMTTMFSGCSSLRAIDCSSFVTDNVVNMTSMFYNCSSLQSLNLSYFNTSAVRNLAFMFFGCTELRSINLSGFDTRNVENMMCTFSQCSALQKLDLSAFKTPQATTMRWLFDGCASLQSLDISGFDTSSVTDMRCMFSNCPALSSLSIGDAFRFTKVNKVEGIFDKCPEAQLLLGPRIPEHLRTEAGLLIEAPKTAYAIMYKAYTTQGAPYSSQDVDVLAFDNSIERHVPPTFSQQGIKYVLRQVGSPIDVYNKEWRIQNGTCDSPWQGIRKAVICNRIAPKTLSTWFAGCSRLASIEGLQNLDASHVTDMSFMFNDCKTLEQFDLPAIDTSSVTNMRAMFQGCHALKRLDVGRADTSRVTDMAGMFNGCRSLTSLKSLSSLNTSNVTLMRRMFRGCASLSAVDLSHFDTRNVTSMQAMFSDCSKLIALDLSCFDTSRVTTMRAMFSDCPELKLINLSSFSTENVTDMREMFDGCQSLTALDVSNFTTTKATSMSSMFDGCAALSNIDVSYFSTSNVANMSSMFSGCNSLRSLDISHWSTASLTDTSYMFRGCMQLKQLDITLNTNQGKQTLFDCQHVTNMHSMFSRCGSLSDVDFSGLEASNVEDSAYMFRGCSSLAELDLTGISWHAVKDATKMFADCWKDLPILLNENTDGLVRDEFAAHIFKKDSRTLNPVENDIVTYILENGPMAPSDAQDMAQWLTTSYPETYVKPDSSDPYCNVGRNDPCPCGSGKKFKNCHGKTR